MTAPRSRGVGHLLVAGTSGFVILTLEFAAVRLFAPSFGQSSYVWSTVIGLLLAALAAVYAVGGRFGDRSSSARPLYLAHAGAALWTALVAWGGPDFCASLVPEGLPSPGFVPLAFTGSLIATLVLFAPPVFLAGMTSPFLIRLDARRETTGRTAGGIYAVGTIGSLAACYAAPLYLLQSTGTRNTLWLCAAAFGALATVGLTLDRGTAPSVPKSPEAPSRAPRFVSVAAFGLGLCVTVIEFAAIRFMSPWLGQSNPIWANVIGVMMLAIALGSALGGRLADREGPVLPDLWLAAGWLFSATLAGTALLGWLIPDTLMSTGILPAAWWGSIVASVLLFAPPVLVLSMAIPALVRAASASTATGSAAGRIFALNTMGGIAGALLTPVVMIPLLGSRLTLMVIALVIAGLWWVTLESGRGRRPAAIVIALIGCVIVATALKPPDLRVDPGQTYEVESRYQTIRVVEQHDARWLLPTPVPALAEPVGRGRMRYLRHDEDAETFQSSLILAAQDDSLEIWNKDAQRYDPYALSTGPGQALLTGGQYFEHLALGSQFVRREQGTNLKVLIIGYAGGTVHRILRETLPEGLGLDILGIEIDPGVIDVANEWLQHEALASAYTPESKERFRLETGEDARTIVNALPAIEVFDIVLVDAYSRTNYLPFQLASVEFFEKLKAHLAPDGWVGVNVLGNGTKSPVARSVARTLSKALGKTYMAPNPTYPGNVILWSSPGATSGPRIVAGPLKHMLTRRAAYCLERLLLFYDPDSETDPRIVVLTDDKSPSDRLADQELGL